MRCLSLAILAAAGAVAFAPVAQAGEESPAPAAAPAPAATTPAAKPAMDDPNRLICKREHVVGSNRPQKVCMTVAQRDAAREASARAMEDGLARSNPKDSVMGN
ncbi:MAG: hypothetical protein ACOYM5_01320 [Caulobacter sp.]|jgi:hypothetical protein